MTATNTTLTKLEREILDHRLSIPDCIADALTDVCEGDPESPYTREAIEEVATLLHISRDIDRAAFELWSDRGQIVFDVLKDAVDGSTYCAAAEHNVTPQNLGRIVSAGYSLARKISILIGETVEFPTY